MESVEEMCDHIALIHKSNKILDGKLIDIKRAHKSNTFEIALATENNDLTSAKLSEKYTLSKASFKSIYDELQFRIQIPENITPNQLIQELTSMGRLTHFVEVIPSANDIFIQNIQNN